MAVGKKARLHSELGGKTNKEKFHLPSHGAKSLGGFLALRHLGMLLHCP